MDNKDNNSNNNSNDFEDFENELREIDPNKLELLKAGPLTDEELEELKEKLGLDFEEFDLESAFEEMDFLECPEIGIETDDFFITLNLKKDYSEISDLNDRKIQLISDIHFLFDEFSKTPDFDDLMKFYDEVNEEIEDEVNDEISEEFDNKGIIDIGDSK
ncbi:MAG: hypothetical protein ACRC1M_00310 [Methanobacteriaceae archaeon]